MHRALLPVALLVFSGCLASFNPIESAGWEAGNEFGFAYGGTYTLQATLRIDGQVVDEINASDDNDELFNEAMRVLSTKLFHEGEPIYVVLNSYQGESTFAYGIRQKDFVYLMTDVSGSPCNNCPGGVTGTMTFRTPTTFHPAIQFPLTSGDTWSTQIDGSVGPGEFDVNMDNMTVEAAVLGMERITVGNLTTSAVRIEHHVNYGDLSAFERSLEQEMEEQGVTDASVQLQIEQKAVYHFSPEIRHFVRGEATGSMTFHQSGVVDGQAIAVDGSSNYVFREDLVSYAHGIGPDMTEEEVARVALNPASVPPVTGGSKSGEPFVSVTSATPVVQYGPSADPVSMSFQFSYANADAVTWELQAPDGTTTKGTLADGATSLEVEATMPGRYALLAVASRGEKTGSSIAEVAVNARIEADATCPPVGAALAGLACDAFVFQVAPDGGAITATALREGVTGIDPGMGTLNLVDPQGRTVDQGFMGANEASVSTVLPGPGGWTLQFNPTGATGNIRFVVDISYEDQLSLVPEMGISVTPFAYVWGIEDRRVPVLALA